MASVMDRRTFVKGSLAAGLALATGAAMGQPAAEPAVPKPVAEIVPRASLPQGRIGSLLASRLILGGNLLSRYNHSRDLNYVQALCAHYLTDEKILETLALAEQHGVDTLSVHDDPDVLRLLVKHRGQGGQIKWILHTKVPLEGDLAAYREAVLKLADKGADALYVWGAHADPLVEAGKVDLIARAMEVIKETNLPAGVAAHDLRVVEACEKAGVPNDFYFRTFHHHHYPSAPRPDELKGATSEVPGYWCRDPQRTIELMKSVKKPWIAYKVMAAGAIPPTDAFRYAFANGADFVLAGMFDFEIAEDARLIRQAYDETRQRDRPWVA